MNWEILGGAIGCLLLGVWLTYEGYFIKPPKKSFDSMLKSKAQMLGPSCLLFFLYLMYKFLSEL